MMPAVRQWKSVCWAFRQKGEQVVPYSGPKNEKDDNKNDGVEEEFRYLAGFMCFLVFRVEDTNGEPLDYEQLEFHPLTLLDVARKWGIDTRPVSSGSGFYGFLKKANSLLEN